MDLSDIHGRETTSRNGVTTLLISMAVFWSMMLNAADDAVYDDKDSLIPHIATRQSVATQDAEQAATRSVMPETLLWRIRATEIFAAGENIYNIPVLEEQENELRRVGGSQRKNIFIPTQVYLAVGDTITITTDNYPSLTTRCSAHTFPDFDTVYTGGQTNRRELLRNSSRSYEATVAGLLMFACVDTGRNMSNWASWGKTVKISTTPAGKKSSLYVYGVTPPGDWPAIARSPDPSGQVYLFNGRTVMNFPSDVAAYHADKDIDAMLQEHLIITTRYDQLNGFSWQTEAPLDTQALSMFQASFKGCCWSNYYNGLIGINFGGDRVVSHWGDWHEYGHQAQLAWKWGYLTEISNNLFSLEACRMLTGNKLSDFTRCHPNLTFISPDPEAVGTFLKSNGIPDLPPDVAANRVLLMLAQLYMSFPDWHAQLAKDFRVAYARGDNAADFATDQRKIDWFVLNSSRIAGRDLRSFFDKWELQYSASAGQAIADLKLPQPLQPSVQYSAPWNLSQSTEIEGTIPVPLLQHSVGLVAYGSEEGPTKLQRVENETYTKLRTLVVGAKRMPYYVVLRGTLKHGGCSPEDPMHAIRTCVSNDRNVYWKLSYHRQDNVLPLPDDNYEGVLRLALRAAYNPDWGGTLTVPLTLNVSTNP